MDYRMSPIEAGDGEACLAILNHYIAHSQATFFEKPLPPQAANQLLSMFKGYPNAAVKDAWGRMAGFGFLRAHNQIPTFSRTAELSYFIDPEFTRNGLGTRLLGHLEAGARAMGLRTLLASIAAENTGSLRFHEKNGFLRCGLFQAVYEKNGMPFDVIFMQKMLWPGMREL
jgi:phosphinothricin acetyltransferase